MELCGCLVAGVLILVPTVWLLLWYFDQKKRKEFKARNLKYVTFPNPFLSAARKVRSEELFQTMIAKEGNVFGFSQFSVNQIFIAQPELVQIVMSKEFTNFADRRKVEIDDEIFSNTISAANGEKWKRLRSIITPAFSTGKLRRMKPCIDSTIQTMLHNIEKNIQQNNVFEVKQLYSAYTMDTIVQSSFGIKVDSFVDKDNPLVTRARKLFAQDLSVKDMARFGFIYFMPKLSKLLGFRVSNAEIDYFKNVVINIINKKRKELATEIKEHKSNNFIELLLEVEAEKDEDEDEMADEEDTKETTKKVAKYITNDELVAQAVVFFMVGFETTASTITFASYLLAVNPETQDKLYEDIVSTLKRLAKQTNNNDNIDEPFKLITFESLARFEYLTAVVNETLRLYAPSPMTERSAANDITLETEDGSIKINVKKGDIIEIPIHSLHYDPNQFPEPKQFKPERFLDESTRTFHKYAYIPFGSGPRNCVARSFALIEVKNAILHTVLRYKLSLCSQTTVPVELYYQGNFVTPKNVYLTFEKR